MSARRRVIAILAAVIAGCSPIYHERQLPAPLSAPAPPTGGRLRAGVGKADFTPPPGVGLGGNGPEGLRSDGWRLHLFARALVLEDPAGERLALVAVDLPHVSANLHREVAARVVRETGIGADRLILGATHTHSGPSHYYAEKAYNDQASRVAGYDPEVERLLIARISHAVRKAAGSMREAWAGWSIASLDGVARNRSTTAYCRNPSPAPFPSCDRDSSAIAGSALDRRLAVLRIDTMPPPSDPRAPLPHRPAALVAVYPIHSTGNSSGSTLLDGDIHGRVMDRLERDFLGGPQSVALFFNGTEGDASPAIPPALRCAPPAMGTVGPITLVRGIERRYDFIRGRPRQLEDCLERAHDAVGRLAATIATAIEWQATKVTAGQLDPELPIRRAFATVPLSADSALCPMAAVGAAAIGGAEDAQTRVWKWQPFWPIRFRFHEGGAAAVAPPRGCHGAKRQLGGIQTLLTGTHGLPDAAQLTVARVGRGIALVAVPAEVTTVAGYQMRRAVAEGLGWSAGEADSVVVIGLANGFLQYVNTAAEYAAQSYEGGSNLYGPNTATVLTRGLGELAATLRGASVSPPATVAPIVAFPGVPRAIMPDSQGQHWLGRRALRVDCDRGAVRARWNDQRPGTIQPWSGEPLIRMSAGGVVVADGSFEMTVRAGPVRRGGRVRWEARWRPAGPVTSARVELTAQRGFPADVVTFAGGCGASR